MTHLVVRGGALGDFVLTVPTIQALRRRADRLVLVCRPRFAEPWPALADRVIDIDAATWLFGTGPLPEPIDAAVAWTDAGARALHGLGIAEVRGGTPRPPTGVHASDHLWSTAGLGRHAPPPTVEAHPRARARVERLLGDRRPVVLAPGAGAGAKRWLGLADVATRLADRGVPVAWLPGRDEGLAGERPEGAVLPALDLAEAIALASLCGAWVGNDTGTSHLAAAAGAPLIVLFGPTEAACWAPRPPPDGQVEVLDFSASPRTVAALAENSRRRLLG